MKSINIIFGLALVLGIFAAAADAQNYRLKQTSSMNGQKTESTIYVRGQRKRTEGGGYMGMGGDVADVEQCDLKQNLKISDKKKMYAVEPFDTGSTDAPAAAPKTQTPRPKTASTRGGVVTYVYNTTDTGERKQIFGMTARHIKTSMSMEASPDACSKQDMSMESDGWYIDLPEFSCPFTMRPQTPQMPTDRSGGCRDEMRYRSTGSGKLGFALMETRNMSMGGGMTFTMSTETIEFSKATLDAALFDIPQGYARTENSQELYGKPDLSALMRAAQSGGDDEDKPRSKPSSTPMSTMPMQTEMPDAKKPGSIRIGVLPPTNRGGESISITNMQSFLAQKLTSGNVEGVAVGSEADARSAGCDYLLTSDFSKLKQSAAAKIGGMFGKITNTGVNGSYDTQVDYTLTTLKSGQVKLQNKAMSKTETNVDRAAESVLEIEAGAIVIAAIKN